jgi:two-component system chemotaxis response regulator CheB
MPPYFTRAYAERLDRLCELQVREAVDGEPALPGTALVAPGGKHLLVRERAGEYRVCVKEGPLVSGHRPSVDVLFRSVAEAAGARALGLLLTGMGADGARGLLQLREAGAHTCAQDEQSCVVFGMPRVAIELGAVHEVLALSRMPEALLRWATRPLPTRTALPHVARP